MRSSQPKRDEHDVNKVRKIFKNPSLFIAEKRMMTGESILLELGIIIGIAAVFALIGRLIKQPTVIAYLITGIIIGPLFFNVLKSTELIQIFAHLGVAFLLFIVGLSLDFRALKEMKGVAFAVGIGQIVITSFVGFLIAVWMGFSNLSALFLAAALAFSSTVFVTKLLSDKKELDTLHGRITLGILIVQDFVAAIVLLLVPIIGSATAPLIGIQLLKGVMLIISIFLFSHLVIPGILSIAAKNQEVLFLFSIGWALMISIVFYLFGFSIEMGALIAGMSLASSKFSFEIGNKIKGLREFFVIIHLIFFGSLLLGPITPKLITSALIFSALLIIGTPVIVMSIMKFFGYKKQTSFMTGINISQISEFSLIIVFLSFTSGILAQETLSLVILVALITIGLSSYEIYYSRLLYRLVSPLLGIFDGKGREPGIQAKNGQYDIILFGYNRIGFSLVKSFEKLGKKFVIVDFNPKTITDLTRKGIPCIYGDANDVELLNSLNMHSVKVVISTIPDVSTNIEIKSALVNKKSIFIPTSHTIEDTKKLYRYGADYVIMPHFLGGEFMAHLILKSGFGKEMLQRESLKQKEELAERTSEGHEHPSKDNHGN